MRLGSAIAFLAGVAILVAQPTAAQDLFFYPSQGQSPDQQNRDFGECHAWAIQQTGYNPMAQQGGPPQEASQGGVLRGAEIDLAALATVADPQALWLTV